MKKEAGAEATAAKRKAKARPGAKGVGQKSDGAGGKRRRGPPNTAIRDDDPEILKLGSSLSAPAAVQVAEGAEDAALNMLFAAVACNLPCVARLKKAPVKKIMQWSNVDKDVVTHMNKVFTVVAWQIGFGAFSTWLFCTELNCFRQINPKPKLSCLLVTS